METEIEEFNETPGFGICGCFLIIISYLITLITFPFSIFFSLKVKSL